MTSRVAERESRLLVIVDDEADVLQSVHDLLRMDYQVVTFQHGAEHWNSCGTLRGCT